MCDVPDTQLLQIAPPRYSCYNHCYRIYSQLIILCRPPSPSSKGIPHRPYAHTIAIDTTRSVFNGKSHLHQHLPWRSVVPLPSLHDLNQVRIAHVSQASHCLSNDICSVSGLLYALVFHQQAYSAPIAYFCLRIPSLERLNWNIDRFTTCSFQSLSISLTSQDTSHNQLRKSEGVRAPIQHLPVTLKR